MELVRWSRFYRSPLYTPIPLLTLHIHEFATLTSDGLGSDGVPSLPDTIIDVTEAQVRWQVWMSVAFGSTGLWYYFYFEDPAHFHCRNFMLCELKLLVCSSHLVFRSSLEP